MPAIQASDDGVLAAVASRSADSAKAFAKACGIPKAYGSYEALLADPDIDAIYNPLPVSLHAEWSIRCAEAGKPVLCEKPMAPDAAEAERMAAAFEAKGLLLAEALMYRYHPLTRKALEIVHGGGIGEVRIVRASFHGEISDPSDIRLHKALGGGALLDLGVYCISILRHALREEPVRARTLARIGAASEVDETLASVLEFPSGALGYFGCGFRTQFDCSYEISGTEGRVLVDWGAMCAWPGTEFRIKLFRGGEQEEIAVPAFDHYTAVVNDFNRSLQTGCPMTFGMEDTLNNLRAMDLVRRAYEE